jgi:hypothetical protein
LCDISSFTTSPQPVGEHTLISCSAPNILQENENKSKLRPHIQDIIPQLLFYSGEFDPKAYVNWEMEVDKEYIKFELFEEQKVLIGSMVLTNYALNL